MQGPIEAVVFDIGGVLLDWDPRYVYRPLFDDEQEMERFLTEICTLEWHQAHDRGRPFEESCAELAARHPEYSDLIHAWGQRSEDMIAGPIDETVELLRRLKAAGIPCYALTNMETQTFPLRFKRFPFFSWFDGAVVSGFEGTIKPEREIFERLLERFNLAPDRTLFVDDSQRNVDAARGLGIQAVLFESPAAFEQVLAEAGLLRAAA
jgi:2-haloacid dehalogenase